MPAASSSGDRACHKLSGPASYGARSRKYDGARFCQLTYSLEDSGQRLLKLSVHPEARWQRRRRQCCQVRAEAEPSEGQASTLAKSGNSFKALKDIEEIQKLLPHRVIEFEAQKYAIGYKNITANDNFFTGHFPDRKIMPGVLQVEAMAQLGGIVMMDPDNATAQQNFFFGGIEACKFRRPVVPGDTLMMKVDLTKYNKRYGIAKMSAKAYVGPDLACEADLTLVMAK